MSDEELVLETPPRREGDEPPAPEKTLEPLGIELQIHDLQISGASIAVHKHPETDARLVVVGPILLRLVIPLDALNARTVGRDLTGGVEVAATITPDVELAGKRLIRR